MMGRGKSGQLDQRGESRTISKRASADETGPPPSDNGSAVLKRGYYHGWTLVAYTVACTTVITAVVQGSFGLFVLPVSKEYGLSRADMNTVVILGSLGGALAAPFLGWMADRLPPRPMLVFGSLVIAAGFATLGLTHSVLLSATIVAFVLQWGVGLAGRTGSVLVVRWFDAHRGRALTVSAMGLSLAGILIVPCIGLLLQHFNWRTTLLIAGAAATAVVLVPGLLLRLDQTPEEAAREKKPQTSGDLTAMTERTTPLAVRTILAMPQFWCIGFAIAIPMSVSAGIVISLAPMAIQAGIPIAYAATFASAAGIMAITGKVGLAVIADKANQMLLLTAVFFIGAVENVVLFVVASHVTYPALVFCSLLQGLSSGALMPLLTVLLAKQFGPASFGTVFGVMYPIILVLNAVAARFIGEVYDHTGSYRLAFAIFVVLQIFAAGLIFLTSRMRPPVDGGPSKDVSAQADLTTA